MLSYNDLDFDCDIANQISKLIRSCVYQQQNQMQDYLKLQNPSLDTLLTSPNPNVSFTELQKNKIGQLLKPLIQQPIQTQEQTQEQINQINQINLMEAVKKAVENVSNIANELVEIPEVENKETDIKDLSLLKSTEAVENATQLMKETMKKPMKSDDEAFQENLTKLVVKPKLKKDGTKDKRFKINKNIKIVQKKTKKE
jgi:tRNA nucleotidyltransferase/poly(A) polymerase